MAVAVLGLAVGGERRCGMRYHVTIPVTVSVEAESEAAAIEFASEVVSSADCDSTDADGEFVAMGTGEAVVETGYTDEQYREAAYRVWNGYDLRINIDDDAKVSRSDEGHAWVQAWVVVNDSEVES